MTASTSYSGLVFQNLILIGFSSVCPSHESVKIQSTAKQMIKDYDLKRRKTPPFVSTPITIVFPIAEDLTNFWICDAKTRDLIRKFDIKNIPCFFKATCKGKRCFLVFTHLEMNEDSLADSSFDSKSQTLYVFQCCSIFEVLKINACFFRIGREIKRAGSPLAISSLADKITPTKYSTNLRLHVDIREIDTQNSPTSTPVPKERPNLFKLRVNLEKILVIGVSQPGGTPDTPPLRVHKCLGIGLAFGRFISDADMAPHISIPAFISTEEGNTLIPGASFVAKLPWSPMEPQFKLLNTVTAEDRVVFFTVTCRLLLEMLPEVITLKCVFRARILRREENHWILAGRRPFTEDFPIQLSEIVDEREGWIVMNRFSLVSMDSPCSNSSISTEGGSTECKSTFHKETSEPGECNHSNSKNDNSDKPRMLASEFPDCEVTDDHLLAAWRSLISEWQMHLSGDACTTSLSTPLSADEALVGVGVGVRDGDVGKRLQQLSRRGIPATLRPEAWQVLAGDNQAGDLELMQTYRILVTRPCRFDQDIRRDLPLIITVHDFVRDQTAQGLVFSITRAFALYDPEVGYCHGITYIAAALLQYLPEEKAFCLLVKMMSNYGIRHFFLRSRGGLSRCLYQLENLIQDQLPDVGRTFKDLGIKCRMYARQWFLTFFMTGFPLNLVFRIFDIFLCDGLLVIFKVMIALLRISRRNLLGLDFKGTLNYFRYSLPSRLCSPETCDELIVMATSSKIDTSRLIEFAKDWEKNSSKLTGNTRQKCILECEVWKLQENHARLLKENESLTSNILASRSTMRAQIDQLKAAIGSLKKEYLLEEQKLLDKKQQCHLLEHEIKRVNYMLQMTREKHDLERQNHLLVIQEYKSITLNLFEFANLESPDNHHKLPQVYVDAVMGCCRGSGECKQTLNSNVPGWYVNVTGPEVNYSPSELSSGLVDPIESRATTLSDRVKQLELQLAQIKARLVDEQVSWQNLNQQLLQITSELRTKHSSSSSLIENPRKWLAQKLTAPNSNPTNNDEQSKED